ncbi:MAG: ABC transporter ATP-binding protein [Terrisporobacter sp.]
MEILKFCYKYLKVNLFLFLSLIFINILGSCANIYITYITGEYIDLLVLLNSKTIVFKFGIIFFVSTLISIFCSYISNMILCRLQNKSSYNLQDSMFEHIKNLPIEYFDNKDTIYLTDRVVKDCNEVISFTINSFLNVLINILSLLIYTIFLISVDYKVLIFLIIIIPIYCLAYYLFKKPLYNNNYKYKENQNKLYTKSYNQIKNINFIKSHSLFNIVREDFRNTFNETLLSAISNMRTYSSFLSLGSLIKTFLNVSLFFYSGISIINKHMTVGNFIVLNRYLSKIMGSVQYFLNFTTTYQNTKVSYMRIKEILNIDIEVNGSKHINQIENISLIDVKFSYDSKNILNKFNYIFEKGNVYGVVGPNGTGKSTLINLIIGILQDYEGKILYNSENIKNLNMYNIRYNKIGIVDQKPIFIKDTIIENLTSYNKDISKKNIIKYFDEYNINYFINNDNMISDKKIELLSGGEMQKISLIRELLKEASLFILDEPTTYLDSNSVKELKKDIKSIKENSIVIIISHDNMFLDISDKIIDLSSYVKIN